MPKTTFKPENKANESAEKYPRLKFGKDERGRICCVADPVFEFVHTLRAPKIINGEPLIEVRKRKDGTTYEEYDKEFIGQPICAGDVGILMDKGVDTKNCPGCVASQRSDAVPGPVRRYAMPILKYGIRPGGWELAAPFSVRVEIWAFTARMFDQLVDLATEWGSLKDHDLLLGPCEDANYQKFKIAVGQQAMWQYNDQTKLYVKEAWTGRPTDKQLEDACGWRPPSMERLADDITRTEQRWHMARRAGTMSSNGIDLSQGAPAQTDIAAGLEGLLDSQSPAALAPAVADPFAGADPFAAQAAPAAAPAPHPEAASDPFTQPSAPTAPAPPVTAPAPAAVAPASPSDPFAGGSPEAGPSAAPVSPTVPAAPSAPAAATAPVTPAPAATPPANGDVPFDELLGL